MITLKKIRDLDLTASNDGACAYLSAASGLQCAGSFLYVVADDELHLGVFRMDRDGGCRSPGELVRLFEGALPPSLPERKKQKPDLEALTLLPPSEGFPNGAMLALGSGSTPKRRAGVLLGLDRDGALEGVPKIVDLAPVFDPLDARFPQLNIEGAVVSENEVRLFQRGNSRNSENAIVRFALPSFVAALSGKAKRAVEPAAIQRIDLGAIEGTPLTFTDAAALPNGDMVFTAVAEDTEDAYNDGPCTGAAIGILKSDGHLSRMLRLDAPFKVEGVDARMDGNAIRLLLVTDADNPTIPATLFSATMER